ncbi:MAG: tRNA (N(6)-L-threonylcarbamoyladenosine(37)-C(2))-methylthiotransferase MtaB [Treponema sp.]|nr:tRNA (N(6)-L-threonylcarbamoyladenosine(37)-C(2))-methylthiotransferase MtaB [Treponema sp.]
MKTIRIETLGCRLNQIESEAAAHYFLKDFDVQMQGLSAKATEDKNTVLVIINTCTVTQKAEQKARRIIRLALKKYENAALLITGCYAQLSAPELLKMDKRIIVLGGQIKSRLVEVPSLLKNYLEENKWKAEAFAEFLNNSIKSKPQEKLNFPEESFKLAGTSFLSHSRAALKIQDGCNNNCSYCAIHMARGHSVSIDAEVAIKRVQELEEKGNEEVVLTTVNIGQYKSEYKGKEIRFPGLLKLLLENTKSIRFRISSLYPEVVDDEFCRVIKDQRVQPHFHLSVQSGSNKILKLMNRVYKAEDVLNACKKLKTAKENPFIACDIITGFPGETNDDFDLTYKLCKDCDFTWIHAFPYSERPGTKAIELPQKVPQSVSDERARKLNELAVKNKIEYIKIFIDKPMDAILETVKSSQLFAGNIIHYHAVTSNFLHCEIISKETREQRKLVKIKILSPMEDRIQKGGELEARAVFV